MTDNKQDETGDFLEQLLAIPVAEETTAGDALEKAGGFVKDNAVGLGIGSLGALLLTTRSGRSIASGALKLGGAALVGTLAYKAYKNWTGNGGDEQQSAHSAGHASAEDQAWDDVLPEPGSGFSAGAKGRDPDHALALVRAMISAAKADGRIDADEQRRILERVDTLPLGPDTEDFLRRELQKPVDIEPIVAAATGPEKAAELYLASVLAIDPDTKSEQGYLATLAERLNLKHGLVAEIHAAADEVRI